jgi:3D-(3,5/4)-trihydroxycyclohexane-1,2-dione acylhydrolase (decyclizing)
MPRATVRITMAQALVRFLAAQTSEVDGRRVPLFAGVWAIFGHGNVTGLGEALESAHESLPTYRAHNEQAMAHAAVAFAKASRRRRVMACTTSIGPGATNMVTAAAVAHVNRLPVLLLPGDVFASRRPDPVLQQIESFSDGTVSANDCFRPVSRYFDRIVRPEQIVPALQRAMQVLTDPAECGPVTLALCQDVQTQACDFPLSFFESRHWHLRRPTPDAAELDRVAAELEGASAPLIIAGGGVVYSSAETSLRNFAERFGVPVAVTQAGKGSLPDTHPLCLGSIGVTGTTAANAHAEKADVVLAIGTRLQDFTTGSRALFKHPGHKLVGLNIQPFDAWKHDAIPLVADARAGMEALFRALPAWRAPEVWTEAAKSAAANWADRVAVRTARTDDALPSDAAVIGAMQRGSEPGDVVVCAAGGLPGELHKLWRASAPSSYHLEYGYSCMGYEIAGGLGVKLADPRRHVIVMVGDGSYLMMNSEIATSIMLGLPLLVVVLDNGGFGCIDRLQRANGGRSFNNLLTTSRHVQIPVLDFAAHAASMGAISRHVSSIDDLEVAVREARSFDRTCVLTIKTDPRQATDDGGHWWDVPVAEVSSRQDVRLAREAYDQAVSRRQVRQ